MKVETVVYNDPSLPSTWIDATKKYPEKIAEKFSAKKFRILDAIALKDFMIEALETNLAHQKLVVFSKMLSPGLLSRAIVLVIL